MITSAQERETDSILDSFYADLGFGVEAIPESPKEWADQIGLWLVGYQREIIDLFQANARLSVPAGNGVGKGYLGALLGLHWVEYWPSGTAKLVVTGPTLRQVTQSIWSDMRVIRDIAEAAGHTFKSRIGSQTLKIGDTQVGLAFSASDTRSGSLKSLGTHSPHLLVIVDEANGMLDANWRSLERYMTGAGGKMIALGNTDIDSGRFYEVTTSGSWATRPVPATECPAVTGEDCPPEVRDALTQPEFIQQVIDDYGEDSDQYRASVNAEFPVESSAAYFPAVWVRRARKRTAQPKGRPRLGVDCAGAGADANEAVAYWPETGYSELVTTPRLRSTVDESVVAREVELLARNLDASVVQPDSVGPTGFNAMMKLSQQLNGSGITVVGVNSGEPANNRDKYTNLKTELHAKLRRLLQEDSITLPDDNQLCRDLTALQTIPPVAGRQATEKKMEVKRRLGRSPDRGDALLLAIAARPVLDYGAG